MLRGNRIPPRGRGRFPQGQLAWDRADGVIISSPRRVEVSNLPTQPRGSYLFVDGGYLRRVIEDFGRRVYKRRLFPEIQEVAKQFAAEKTFYYDCSDKTGEVESFLEEVQQLDNCHVRQGVLSGNTQRQKQVDVHLAVEALMFAMRGVSKEVTLVAGDRDFVPLVDALVSLGASVNVVAHLPSCSIELGNAADRHTPLRIPEINGWYKRALKMDGIEPVHAALSPKPCDDGDLLGQGALGERQVLLHDCGGTYELCVAAGAKQWLRVRSAERWVVEGAAGFEFGGRVRWDQAPRPRRALGDTR